MAPFQDRAPRLNLSFPLEFRNGSSVVPGHCLNLSESGLLGIFSEALDLWTEGELLLQFGGTTCRVPALVARSMDREAGLAFAFRDESTREQVRTMLLQAAQRTHLVGAPPF